MKHLFFFLVFFFTLPVSYCQVCGNSIIDEGTSEVCDDGNTWSNDGCSSTCLVETGWSCSGGSSSSSSKCSYITGDGKIVSIEECDDGNSVNGDGCNSKSQIEMEFKCTNTNGNIPVSSCWKLVYTED